MFFLIFAAISPKAFFTEGESELIKAPPVPVEIMDSQPLPMEHENFTEYLDTTNPYSDLSSPLSAIDEVGAIEGRHPIYVLVAGDEEERQKWRYFGNGMIGSLGLHFK